MSNEPLNTYDPTSVSPPGQTLRDILDERGITQSELAARMGRPEKTISEIVHGKTAITADTAIQLEYVLEVPASFWNNRESNYREYLARQEVQSRLEIETAWMRQFPVREMIQRGWIERVEDEPGQVRELLRFYGVASGESWDEWHRIASTSFRKSQASEGATKAVSAWLRQGERLALEIHCEPYSDPNFKAALHRIRAMSREVPEVFTPQVVELCADAGVAFVLVPQLPKTRASGATRWLSPSKSLMQLSLRFKTDDHFWFTFFHEAAHILFHSKKAVFLEEIDVSGEEEIEADLFASNFLIPETEYREFIETTSFSKANIAEFAGQLGIAPGIVVGRLQHDELLPFSHCNALKRKFKWVTSHKLKGYI